ncbi:MAG: type IV toxin-antitoxin system AbiEi family antitoxin [Castellaniella sp.]
MKTPHSLSTVLDAAERSGTLNLSTQDISAAMPGVRPTALNQALYRQQQRGRLIRISRGSGHWLIVPLQYATAGAPPLEVWLDRYLRKTLGIPYYVTLLSAAETYGASPYAVMTTQVMVPERRRPIVVGRNNVVFYTRARAGDMPTRWYATADGRFRVGTPELTALELVERMGLVGGIARVRAVLQALFPSCSRQGLVTALEALQEIPIAQRLGALLALDDQNVLAGQVSDWLHGKPQRLVPLEHGETGSAPYEVDATFKVRLPADFRSANTLSSMTI